MIPTQTICHTCGGARDPARHDGHCPVCLLAAAFEVAAEGGALGTIGGHDLIEEIARGGMGVVYRARQREPERIVALKTMRGAELDSPGALVRFRQEAKAMADLEHAAILPVFAFGEQDGVPFFTMKLATGGSLAQRLGGYAGKWREIAELIARVADAVQHAHTRAVLHRDLKPANILFDESDHAFVADFGLAKLLDSTDATITRTTAVLGTPHYLAPEIAAHDARAATTTSDVWSLGVILYELLAQRRPFEGDSIPAILRAITGTEPRALRGGPRSGDFQIAETARCEAATFPRKGGGSDAGAREKSGAAREGVSAIRKSPLLAPPPRDLAVIAMKALAKEPARRYASAGALADDLRRWLDGRPILARPVSSLEKIALWSRRNPALATITAVSTLLLVAGVAGIAIQWRRAEAAERATRERLAHEHVRAGLRLADDRDALRGLPHYVEALRLGLGDPAREQVARLRFEMAVRQAPQLAQLWLPDAKSDVQLTGETGLVVISAGQETRVWDTATGAAVSPPMRHTDVVRRVWTDERATRIVTGTRDDHLTIWDAATGTALTTLPGEPHVRAVLAGPRLRLAALLRAAGTATCISALDGTVDATFSPPEKIEWVVLSPDCTRLLAGSKRNLLLWDVAARALVVPPLDFGGEPDFGTFDPTGRLAGLRAKGEGRLAVLDLTTGAIVARGETKTSGSIKHGWLDGKHWAVLTRGVGGSMLRDGASDRLLFDAPIGARTVLAEFAARRNIFALAGENGAAQLWDADAAKPLTPRLWMDGRPGHLALSADGATLLISSSEPAVRLWKLPALDGTAWSAEGKSPALAVWWNAAGTVLHSIGEDARLNARDAATGKLAGEERALDEAATCAAPDAAGRFVFLGGTHGARLWNAETGEPAGPLIPCAGAIRDVALSADGRRAAVLLENETQLCDPASGAVQLTLPSGDALRCLLSADGARLVTIADKTVQLWDAATGAPVGEPFTENKWREASARFDATGRRLAVWWSWPDTLPGDLRVIETTSGRETLPRLKHVAGVKYAAFSAAGDLLATGTRDQRLWLWRLRDGQRALAPIQHEDRISDVGFSPDGLLVWSRSNREFRTWETATGDPATLLRHRGQPPAKAKPARGSPLADDESLSTLWSSTGRVASSDSRGGVNVWDFTAPLRPLAEMDALARVLSMHRIEPGGGLVPLTREELRAAWAAARR